MTPPCRPRSQARVIRGRSGLRSDAVTVHHVSPELMGAAVSVQRRAKALFIRLGNERGEEAILRQLMQIVARQVQRLLRGGEIVVDVATEISRVVRVDGD